MKHAVANMSVFSRIARKKWTGDWWPIAAGLIVLYVPTFFDLATGLWSSEAYAHSPIIFALSIWLIARQWQAMQKTTAGQNGKFAGWLIFILGLLFYVVGRSQGILIFEIGSFIVVLTAIILITIGTNALKTQWFPLFFMLFMIPLPGTIVDVLTMPMKTAVSYATEHLLFWLGYPIARSGVILQIGYYQLLVADACAGLQTLLTLEALGLFYLNVTRHTSTFRNISLAFFIIPISLTANIIRVSTLTLVTYHFGDEAGQGFLHGFAGMLLFIAALLMIISLDKLLKFLVDARS